MFFFRRDSMHRLAERHVTLDGVPLAQGPFRHSLMLGMRPDGVRQGHSQVVAFGGSIGTQLPGRDTWLWRKTLAGCDTW